jgi:uncharacterized protein YacL (UPF0231 family)
VIICLMCGDSNEFGTNHCKKCGAKLPKLDERTAAIGTAVRTTGKYDKLRNAILKVKTGEHSWMQFADWFQAFYDDIMVRISGLVESINQSHGQGWSYYDEFTEEVEATFAGVEDYDAALAQVWQAIESQDLVLAQSALKIFLRGAERLNDACALNAETQRKLGEGWGHM